MSRFTAPPPNGDSRKTIEQRARDAMRPAAPEKKGRWPFSAPQAADDGEHGAGRTASSGQSQKPA